jgi:hypothetical protein
VGRLSKARLHGVPPWHRVSIFPPSPSVYHGALHRGAGRCPEQSWLRNRAGSPKPEER